MNTSLSTASAAPKIDVQPMSLDSAHWGHVAFHVQFKGGNAPGHENGALPAICAALASALRSQLQVLVPGAQLGLRMVDYGWHEGLFHAEVQRRITLMDRVTDQGGESPTLASPAQCPPQSPAACGTS